jgi:hypothetical protein
MYSLDNGLTWTTATLPSAQTWTSIAWGGDRFMVMSGGSGNTIAYYSFDGINWTATTTAHARSTSIMAYAFPYFVSLHSNATGPDGQRYANYNVLSANTIPVADIVADQFSRSGLTSGEYDTAGVTDSVTGYLVPRVSSARDNIAPLQQAFFFDVVESGAELKLVKRGGSIAATIPDDDLGAHAFGADSPASVSIQRTQEVDLPSRVSVRYANAVGDYLPAVEASRRIVADSRQEEVLELPIALTPNQAAQIAEMCQTNSRIEFGGLRIDALGKQLDDFKVLFARRFEVRIPDGGAKCGLLHSEGGRDVGEIHRRRMIKPSQNLRLPVQHVIQSKAVNLHKPFEFGNTGLQNGDQLFPHVRIRFFRFQPGGIRNALAFKPPHAGGEGLLLESKSLGQVRLLLKNFRQCTEGGHFAQALRFFAGDFQATNRVKGLGQRGANLRSLDIPQNPGPGEVFG